MPTTFESLSVLVIALLPGALYLWSFERLAGRWGARFTDRLLRFVGGSAILHAVFAPATYWFWLHQWPRLRAAEPISLAWWLAAIGYVAIPAIVGSLIGQATRKRWPWATVFTGPDPAPRAWDYVFQGKRDGWIRLRLKSGTWVGGAYATDQTTGLQSYSAGYPEDPDIFLAAAAAVDPETGAFVLDAQGQVQTLGSGLLLRWNEVEYLDFIDA